MARTPTPAGLVRYQRTIVTRFEGTCTFCDAATVPGTDYASLNGKGKWIATCATCASSLREQVKGLVRSTGALAATMDADTVAAIQAQHPEAFATLADVLNGTVTDDKAVYALALALGSLRAALKVANQATATTTAPKAEVTPGLWMVNGEPFMVRLNKAGTNCYAMRLAERPQAGRKLAWEYFKGGMPMIARDGHKATAAEAAALGHATHHCCFCGLTLTDEGEGKSIEVGYGPVCARKNGLPWG